MARVSKKLAKPISKKTQKNKVSSPKKKQASPKIPIKSVAAPDCCGLDASPSSPSKKPQVKPLRYKYEVEEEKGEGVELTEFEGKHLMTAQMRELGCDVELFTEIRRHLHQYPEIAFEEV